MKRFNTLVILMFSQSLRFNQQLYFAAANSHNTRHTWRHQIYFATHN